MKKIKFLFLLLIFLALGVYGVFVEPKQIQVINYQVQDKELSGLKFVLVGDFHIKTFEQKKLDKIVNLINEQQADLVLSVGDYVNGHLETTTMPIEDIAKGLGKIKPNLYAILGNHDLWHDEEFVINALETEGITVLHNKNAKLNLKGKEFYLAGIGYGDEGMMSILTALKGTKSPVVMLAHTPDEFPKMPSDVNLTLSGHTHGGQIRLPFVGALFTASRYQNKYAQGYIEEKGKKLIVTRGLGESILPVRFNCKPEIVVIEFN